MARDPNAPLATRQWARKLEDKPKYVVSASRHDFPRNNTFRVEGDLYEAVTQLKEKTAAGHPVVAGHGPTLFQGLERSRRLELVSTKRLQSGVLALQYRRKEE